MLRYSTLRKVSRLDIIGGDGVGANCGRKGTQQNMHKPIGSGAFDRIREMEQSTALWRVTLLLWYFAPLMASNCLRCPICLSLVSGQNAGVFLTDE